MEKDEIFPADEEENKDQPEEEIKDRDKEEDKDQSEEESSNLFEEELKKMSEEYSGESSLGEDEIPSEEETGENADQESEDPSEDQKSPKRKKRIIIAVVIIIAAIAAAYIAVSVYYRDKFLMNTTINDIDCSGMTSQEALAVLEAQAESYELVITERGEVAETISGQAISYAIDFGTAVDDLLEAQNSFAWPAHLSGSTALAAECEAKYSEEELSDAVASLECADEENMTESEEPSLSEYDEENGYSLVAEIYGTALDTEYLYELIAAAITSFESEIDLEESGCYTDPVYTSESEEALAMLETANTYAGTTVEFTFGDSSEIVDYDEIGSWLIIGDDLSVTLDEDAAAEYVSDLADEYDTYGKSKSLATSYGSTVTVPGGTYGWKMNQSTTTEDLISYITSGEDYSGDPTYSQKAASHGTNDYGSTYVEINLTAQHLYFYKDGSLVVESDFVSGDLSENNGTHTGAYKINSKETNRTLRGADYESFVNYWMPFNGGEGLHDASWRSTFGGTIYKTNGSHGCVNLPYSAAQKIYNNISVGDAVLVYTLSGTESKSTAEKQADTVEDLIDDIGTVTLDSEDAIEEARSAYDDLSSSAKKYVDNYSTLTAAEEAYQALADAAAEEASESSESDDSEESE